MPIKIVRNDITKIECDAIVNAANTTLLGGGGVDGAIHKAAGEELLRECEKIGGCETGHAKLTKAYKLPCKYVIHAVGPVWRGGQYGEKEQLQNCYRESLEIAKKYECESVAFPLISSGAYGYPKADAFRTAVDVISSFLIENEMLVYVVVFDKSSFQISEKLFNDIASYIDDKYVDTHFEFRQSRFGDVIGETMLHPYHEEADRPQCKRVPAGVRKENVIGNVLKKRVNQVDESFSQMLLRKIDEKGMTDVECYKKANVDRKLFSKIRGDIYYRPKKNTAIAFAIALELSLEETKEMLMKAGFALSRSSKFDIIIEYFIDTGNYNIYEINEALFAFDQSILG